MARRLKVSAWTTLLALLLAFPTPVALGDADPASDVLILQDVFLPYPAPPADVGKRLRATVEAAKQNDYQIKVAVIATEDDLGGVAKLFGEPDRYAAFLGNEIAYNVKKRLLIVMPVGFGLRDGSAAENQALDNYKAPASTKTNGEGLTTIAGQVVSDLAASAGHAVSEEQIAGAAKKLKSDGSSPEGENPFLHKGKQDKKAKKKSVPSFVVFGLPVLLVAIGATLAMWRSRST